MIVSGLEGSSLHKRESIQREISIALRAGRKKRAIKTRLNYNAWLDKLIYESISVVAFR